MGIIAAIELIASIADRVIGSEAAGLLGAFLGKHFFERGELTAEQRDEVIGKIASYAGMRAQLEAEIAVDKAKAAVDRGTQL